LKLLVRPAGIEPATLSLEVRSGFSTTKDFNDLGVQDAAKSILSPPLHAPPAHHGWPHQFAWLRVTAEGQLVTRGFGRSASVLVALLLENSPFALRVDVAQR